MPREKKPTTPLDLFYARIDGSGQGSPDRRSDFKDTGKLLNDSETTILLSYSRLIHCRLQIVPGEFTTTCATIFRALPACGRLHKDPADDRSKNPFRNGFVPSCTRHAASTSWNVVRTVRTVEFATNLME